MLAMKWIEDDGGGLTACCFTCVYCDDKGQVSVLVSPVSEKKKFGFIDVECGVCKKQIGWWDPRVAPTFEVGRVLKSVVQDILVSREDAKFANPMDESLTILQEHREVSGLVGLTEPSDLSDVIVVALLVKEWQNKFVLLN